MKINWKLRLQNKTTLIAVVAQVIAIVYALLALAGIVPGIPQDAVSQVCYMLVELLCLLGIVVDPTTKGVGDSANAMSYTKPK